MDGGLLDFFENGGQTVLYDCFDAVLIQNVDNPNIMPQEFRQWVEDAVSNGFQWPNNDYFGNAMKYLRGQYADNVTTNIKTHCEARLRNFFRMCVYELNDYIRRQNDPNATLCTEQDVKNAVNFAYKLILTTGGNADTEQRLQTLLHELILCGAPEDCDIQLFNICGRRLVCIIENVVAHFTRHSTIPSRIQRCSQQLGLISKTSALCPTTNRT